MKKARYKGFLTVLTLLLCFNLPGWSADAAKALEELLASRSLDSDQTAIYIWDLDADYQVTAYRHQEPIVPASVMKCVSTAELSTVCPYSSKITTSVFIEGSRQGDSFSGAITVVGAGDPSLGDGRHGLADFAELIAKALKRKGIDSFSGEIRVDDTLFAGPATHPTWSDSDCAASYGTGCHAFNFEGNASGKKAVTNPTAVFKRKLISAMATEGIAYTESSAPAKGKREKLLDYSSPSMSDLMRSCMFRSDNLYAETFLRLFGIRNGADGSVSLSSRIAMQHWDALGYPVDGVEIVDGSGLSRSNRLTAEFLGMVLRQKMHDPEYVSFFPLVGEEGTVKSFMKDTPLHGRMALKTGSMNGIQSYAGYVLDEHYSPTHVVVVMTNGLKNRDAYRTALAKFFVALFA